jgi:hypothetical protein
LKAYEPEILDNAMVIFAAKIAVWSRLPDVLSWHLGLARKR